MPIKEEKIFNFPKAMKARGLSKNTMREYFRRVNHWYKFCYEQRKQLNVFQATKKDILAYRSYMLEDGDRSKRTINAHIITVHTFYRMAKEYGKIKTNPADGISYIKTTQPNTPRLNDDQL